MQTYINDPPEKGPAKTAETAELFVMRSGVVM